jgi:hypothetical protein
MSRMTKWILLAAVSLPVLGIAWIFFWPPVYWAVAIEAQVVDADTVQPLEGVIVTANWELRNFLSAYPEGQIAVMETVTDAQGRFTFPSWGPRLRRSLWGFLDYAPQFLLFKNGYEWKRLQNEFWSANNTGVIRHSDWNEKVIKLKKFVGNVEENAKLLGDLDRRLYYVAFFHRDCSWKQIPRMLVALDQEKIQLAKTMGIPSDPGKEHRTIEYWEDSNPGYCGSIKDFLRSYMQ